MNKKRELGSNQNTSTYDSQSDTMKLEPGIINEEFKDKQMLGSKVRAF